MEADNRKFEALAGEEDRFRLGGAPGEHIRLEKQLRRIATRGLELFIALLSTIAILIVAGISFGCNALVTQLARFEPIRKGYGVVSHAYDRLLDRVGQRTLEDERDAPALRLMCSLTLSAVPIFLVQLALQEASLLLAAAFYLSLYGLKFDRFVRMFSVKHLEAHRANGYFAPPYRKVFGRYVEFFLGHLYGGVPELDSTMHMRLHHREHNGPEDIADSRRYDRTSRWDFFTGYLAANLWSALGISAWRYFEAKGQEKNQRRMLQGMARHGFFVSVVFLYNWQIGVLFVLVPFLVMNFIQAIIGWVQHAFYDPDNPNEYLAHTITVIDSVNFMNEGYHLCHHRRAGLHWTEMPGQFEKLREEMKQAGSLVFRDIDFLGVFLEMTLFRRLDVLADRLATWEPMPHDEKVALLRRRTQPIVSHASAAGMPRRPR